MEDNAPFKLKSGNSPAFKMMGSAPAKHLALSHKKADHTTADHKARNEAKRAERKEKWRGSKLYKGLSQLHEDVQSIGTDISKNQRPGTTKKENKAAADAAAQAELDRMTAEDAAKTKADADAAELKQKRSSATNLYEYYTTDGGKFPSVSERQTMYGDDTYTGTKKQNIKKLKELQK